jgi:hypothetical protein
MFSDTQELENRPVLKGWTTIQPTMPPTPAEVKLNHVGVVLAGGFEMGSLAAMALIS